MKRQAPRPFSIEYARIAKPSRKKERRGSNAPENGSNAPPKPNEDGQPSQRISIGWSLRQAIRPVCNHLPRGASGRKLASWVRALLLSIHTGKPKRPALGRAKPAEMRVLPGAFSKAGTAAPKNPLGYNSRNQLVFCGLCIRVAGWLRMLTCRP